MFTQRASSIIVSVLLVVLLSACGSAPTLLLTATLAPTLPPLTDALSPSTPPPTATWAATQPPFENLLVYDMPEMYQVTIETVQYRRVGQPYEMLVMDIYYPPTWQPGMRLPAVIFADAFPLDTEWGACGKSCYSYPSWGRLIAANGLIAVAYETLHVGDLETVVKYIQRHAELGIDGDRLGIMGASADTTLAEAFAYQKNREYVKFAVFYYGYLLTPDNMMRDEADELCRQYGCFRAELPDVKELRTDLPTFIVRVGNDDVVNQEPVDHFIQLAEEAGAPVTAIRFDEGSHGFDLKENSSGQVRVRAIEIVEQTLDFIKTYAFDQ